MVASFRSLKWPLLFAVASVFLTACQKSDEPVVMQGETMGTYWQVSVAAEMDDAAQRKLQQGIEHTLQAVNQSMSTYIADSELMRFNHAQTTEPVTISEGLHQVIAQAQTISMQSDGAYDVTIGPLVELWGFGPQEINSAPEPSQIENVLGKVGYQQLTLSDKGLAKSRVDIEVDLSSIAKGYGVDQVGKTVLEAGYPDFLVDIGGELVVQGSRFGKPWKVGIEVPETDSREIQDILAVGGKLLGIATSGNYRNYINYDGIRAVHTINPKTGRSVQSSLLSVTVLAESCMIADGYATALMVLGDQQAAEFAEKQGLPVLFIYAGDGPDSFQVQTSSRYQTVLKEHSL